VKDVDMRVFILALSAATTLAATAPALAQNVGLKDHPELNLAGFSGDPTALPKAVHNIETLTSGRVVEIRYDNVQGVPGYDVVVAHGPNVKFQRFTRPGSGPVELSEATTPAWMLNYRTQKNVSLASNAKIRLADAIHTASASMGGAPAVAAGIAHGAAKQSHVHAYNVLLVRNGKQQRVAVNSDSGNVIANPQALEW